MAGDDDRFKEMSPAEKDHKLLIPGTSLEIPLRKDWTLLPHVLGVHAYNQIMKKGTEDPETAKKAMKDAFLTAAFSLPTPVPAILKPAVEVAINHDFFTGRDIETQAMDKLDIEEKFTPSTSVLGKWVGETGIMSPVNFDHLFRGYTGSLGAGLLLATDAALSKASGIPYTEKTVREMARAVPGMSVFIGKKDRGGDTAKYYELLNEVTTASSTLKRKEERTPEKVEKYAEEKGKLLDENVKSALGDIRQQLHDIAAEERRIGSIPNKDMSPAEKRVAIEELKQYKKEALSGIQDIRDYVYRD